MEENLIEDKEDKKSKLSNVIRIKNLKKNLIFFRTLGITFLCIESILFMIHSTITYFYLALPSTSDTIYIIFLYIVSVLIDSVLITLCLKSIRKYILPMIFIYFLISFTYALVAFLSQIKLLLNTILPIKYKSSFFSENIYIYAFVINIISWISKILSIVFLCLFRKFNESFEKEFDVLMNNSSEKN